MCESGDGLIVQVVVVVWYVVRRVLSTSLHTDTMDYAHTCLNKLRSGSERCPEIVCVVVVRHVGGRPPAGLASATRARLHCTVHVSSPTWARH